MGLSVARKSAGERARYSAYTRSPAWRWRRVCWFRDCRAAGLEPACPVCGVTLADVGTLDLHHLSYKGVKKDSSGQWLSQEKDSDLVPFCRDCHEALHQLLDERRREFYGWNRRHATAYAIRLLRAAGRKR